MNWSYAYRTAFCYTGGDEPDMILVSSAGNARASTLPPEDLQRIVAAKRRGETHVRNSGLGYTIIRPGLLVRAYSVLGVSAL